MRWFEYKMEVDDLHASDDLKAKLLAMQSQQAVSVPAAKTVTRKQPEVPAHKKALHFPSSRVWKGLAACAAFCVVAGGAASVLHLGVIGVGGAKSSGPATFSSREATGFNMENSVSSYAMGQRPGRGRRCHERKQRRRRRRGYRHGGADQRGAGERRGECSRRGEQQDHLHGQPDAGKQGLRRSPHRAGCRTGGSRAAIWSPATSTPTAAAAGASA